MIFTEEDAKSMVISIILEKKNIECKHCSPKMRLKRKNDITMICTWPNCKKEVPILHGKWFKKQKENLPYKVEYIKIVV